VVGEDDQGVDMEGVGLTGLSDGGAEGCDLVDKEGGAAVEEVYGEEVGAAGDAVAAVVRSGWKGMGVRCEDAMGLLGARVG